MPEIFPPHSLQNNKNKRAGRGRKRERGGRLTGPRYAPSNCKYVYAKWPLALFNDLLAATPFLYSSLLTVYVFGSLKPSEILQPIFVFCFFSFFSNLTKFQSKTHSGCNNTLKRKKNNNKYEKKKRKFLLHLMKTTTRGVDEKFNINRRTDKNCKLRAGGGGWWLENALSPPPSPFQLHSVSR